MKQIVFFCIVMLQMAWGIERKDIEAIGPHHEVFRFEKSENPQNILVIYTKLDSECRFLLESENPVKPVFGFYWLMDGRDYKPVHTLIKSGIADRLEVQIPPTFPQNRDFFAVQVNDLTQIDPKLKNALVRVTATESRKSCDVVSTFNPNNESASTGVKSESAALKLDKIYAESEKTIIPPFRKVISLRFEGSDEKTGQPGQKVFQSEKSK